MKQQLVQEQKQVEKEKYPRRTYTKAGIFRLICISDLQIKIMNHLHRKEEDDIKNMERLFKRDRISIWQSLRALERHNMVWSYRDRPTVLRSRHTYRMTPSGKKAYPHICTLEKLFKH